MADYEKFMQKQEEQDKQERLKRFRDNVRAIGEAVEQSGLSEEQLMAELEEDKQAVYQEHYGNTSNQ